jgi:hypothetical protein
VGSAGDDEEGTVAEDEGSAVAGDDEEGTVAEDEGVVVTEAWEEGVAPPFLFLALLVIRHSSFVTILE